MSEIKTYTGTKTVQAVPALKDGVAGYAVTYPDGYESWSPADTFEACYHESGTWQQRLKIEFDELADRTAKLRAFQSTPEFDALHGGDKEALAAQVEIMGTYLNVLSIRLNDAEVEH